ncbi:MAG: polyribonucleotide nucleotidyltransferase [Cryobacterium sp.]|nr:polyribonucleotide nucleotidyltransferase [Cryobacterium sp.]
MLDGKFAGGDDALGLVTHIEENLVAVDLHNGAFDEVSVVEEFQSLLDRGKKVFSRANVIDGYLLGCLFGRYDCHVVIAPVWTNSGQRSRKPVSDKHLVDPRWQRIGRHKRDVR